MIYPAILCGGSETHLWPLSRKAFPKQFIPLVDEKSLLQLALERVAPVLLPGKLFCSAHGATHFALQVHSVLKAYS
jgi:mannose-1-phosphate guanylyltransferase